MHVLDKVMVPLEQMNTTAAVTPTSTPTATATDASRSTAAATKLEFEPWNWTFGALILTTIFTMGGFAGRFRWTA